MKLPPLPPGFVLVTPEAPREPWETFGPGGFAIGGFGRPLDAATAKARFYGGAADRFHPGGEPADAEPPLTADEQAARIFELFEDPMGRDGGRDRGTSVGLRVPEPTRTVAGLPDGLNEPGRPVPQIFVPPDDARRTAQPSVAAPEPPPPPPPPPPERRGIAGVIELEPRPYRGSDGVLVAASTPPPSQPPVQARPAPITRRDDPRLAGVNRNFASLYARGVSETELAAYLAQYGISTVQIPNWRAAMNHRRTRRFREWLNTPPSRREAHIVNLDDMLVLPEERPAQEGPPIFVTARRPPPAPARADPAANDSGSRNVALEVWDGMAAGPDGHPPFRSGQEAERWNLERLREAPSGAEIREYHPDLAERIGDGFGSLMRPVLGRHLATEEGNNLEALLGWTPVGAYDAMNEYEAARHRALLDGRLLDAAGNDAGRHVAAAGIVPAFVPIVNLVRRTVAAGGRRAAEAARGMFAVRRTADRLAADPGLADEQARYVARNWDSLSDAEIAQFVTARWRALPGSAQTLFARRTAHGPQGIIDAGRVERVRTEARLPSGAGARSGAAPGAVIASPRTEEGDLLADGARIVDDARPTLVADPLERGALPTLRFRGRDEAAAIDAGRYRGIGAPPSHFPLSARSGDQATERGLAGVDELGLDPDRIAGIAAAVRAGTLPPRFALGRADEGAQAGRGGSPLTEGIGDGPGLQGVIAPPPAATAYDDLARLGGEPGGIDLARIESSADVARLIQDSGRRFGVFGDPRRAQLAEAETTALWRELGTPGGEKLRGRLGRAFTAEQASAARVLVQRSSDEVRRLAPGATGPAATEAGRAAFVAALVRHGAIEEYVTGAGGRSGSVLTAMSKAERWGGETQRRHRTLVDGFGGDQRVDRLADQIVRLLQRGAGPSAVNRFAAHAVRPRGIDKAVQLRSNWRLLSPRRRLNQAIGNAVAAGVQIPVHIGAAGSGLAVRGVRAIRGRPDLHDQVLVSELGARIFGTMREVKDGLRSAARTLRSGEVQDPIANLQVTMQRAIGGRIGSAVDSARRTEAGVDEVFSTAARRTELRTLAIRRARAEGLRGAAAKERTRQLMSDPPPEMAARALEQARYLTFQRPLEGVPRDLERLMNRQPWLKLFVPQIRRPTNIVRFVVDHSPLAIALKRVQLDLAAGGERRAVAGSRIVFGTGVGMALVDWANDGIVTGAPPPDPRQRELLDASGWQEDSIRIGDTYHSYQGFGPLATTLRAAAELARAAPRLRPGEAERLGAEYVASIVGHLGEEGWLGDVSALVAAIEDPRNRSEPFALRMAERFVLPSGMTEIAGTIDPVEREPGTPWQRIEARIPGLSDDLPARRDLWGGELPNSPSDSVWPIRTRPVRDETVTRELTRIGAGIAPPVRQVTIDGEPRELGDDEFARYRELAGRYALERLRSAIDSAEWRAVDDETRREWVGEIVADARANALDSLAFPSHPRRLEPGR